MPQENEKHAFWTSLPGVLTGAAAIIAAVGGILITVMNQAQPDPDAGARSESVRVPSSANTRTTALAAPEASTFPAQAIPPPTDWPLVAEETFTEPSGWYQGRFSDEGFIRSEASMTSGKYRWDMEFKKAWERVVESPQGPAVNFYTAIDARFVSFRPEHDFSASILFGRANGKDYTFRLSSRKYFSLSHFDGRENNTVISWTPINIQPDATNRLAVAVIDKQIKLYINGKLVGSYADPDFSGGKVGVGVGVAGYIANSAVVIDFDNFEYRQKP